MPCDYVLCSDCFHDQGLRHGAFRIGDQADESCSNCNSERGRKLDASQVKKLSYSFFVRGTTIRCGFGFAPVIQFNEFQRPSGNTGISGPLMDDMKLIERKINVGFFPYAPKDWMLGDVEPLEALQDDSERTSIIRRIIQEFPTRVLDEASLFYRLRKNPADPSDHHEYDSPPNSGLGHGRLDSADLRVMYGSQDLDVCVHECRVSAEDEIFVASLVPSQELRLLDLTELVDDHVTEFESLDLAVHMLFLAGEHSYDISRAIASAVSSSGYDGIICPSYFGMLRTGSFPLETAYGISIRKLPGYAGYAKSQVIPNVAIFGSPIREGFVRVDCINRLVLNRVSYDLSFGPVDF